MDDPVLVEIQPPLATITLNRPRVLNAMDMDLVAHLDAAVEKACARRDVRVVLVTGAGRAFCAGLDLDMFAARGMPDGFYETQERALRRLELTDRLTVAAVHGHCLGGGLQIALACDIRVCAPEARLGLPAADEGLFPGMAPYRLPRLIGLAAARRLIFSGAAITAHEALRIGLADHVVDSDRVPETIEPYLRAPSEATAGAKAQLREAFDVPFDVSYERSVPLLQACLDSPDAAAARERRKAVKPAAARLHDDLDRWATRQPDAEFAVDASSRLTYGEAAAASRRLAGAFLRHGLEPGDRVAVLARNCAAFVIAFYAASRAGVVLTPLNWRLAANELRALLDDTRPRIVLTDVRHRPVIEAMRPGLAYLEQHLALEAPAGAEDERPVGDANPVLYHLYTSGTTALPKAAMLSQAAVCANVRQVADAVGFAPGERSLVVAPLFHAAVVPSTFAAIARGASLQVLDSFDPAAVIGALGDVDVAVLVPSMIHACLTDVPDVASREYERLRLIYYGASPIAEGTLRGAMDVFGCGFMQSYGLTEATQALTFLSPDDHRRALHEVPTLLQSAGRPADASEIRIVDGEIVARGPQLMSGYWQRPAESALALRDGWLHTGDGGTIDADGYLFVHDRLNDMIVTGGENVSPASVEAVLSEHPAVHDVAVIGVPHERWGEAVAAVVVAQPGSETSAAALMDHCRGRLAGFARPREVQFVDALPRNSTGKLLRRTLRDQFWGDRERRVGGA